jgi:solute carrier family 8 (sodium/calcium exchanger)
MGLKSTVTAITFVALGTSLPDTFASKTAAVQDAGADNAIGNVTGSNAVPILYTEAHVHDSRCGR